MADRGAVALIGLQKGRRPVYIRRTPHKEIMAVPIKEPHQATQARQCTRLIAYSGRAQEKSGLSRRVTPMPSRSAPGLQIRVVKLADSIVGQTGPLPDGARSSFVPNELQRHLEPQPVAIVAIV